MEFFLSLSPEHPPEAVAADCLQGHVSQVKLAREGGFAGVLAGQHLSTCGMQWFPPFQLLSHLAPYCEGMTLGTSVAILPFSHPVLLAEAAATLSAMAQGKVVLGVAAGWNRSEFASIGLTKPGTARQVREGVDIIRRLWDGESVTVDGEYYHLEDVTLALRPGPSTPPIWVGASTPKTVRILAGACDALVYSSHLSVDDLVRLKGEFLDERERLDVGPPSDTPVLRNVFVGPDRRKALETCLPYVSASYEQYGDAGLFRDVVSKAGSDVGRIGEALGERLVAGGPDDVAAELQRVAEQLGTTKMIVRMQWYGMPSELVEESIARFSQDVMPQLASLGTNS
jgi:alkanesulfonate monooxygenase SsuD/methylene tetrahydromethanopterin reductase-like flavin-dependent oxidoreductase (luciferase family)